MHVTRCLAAALAFVLIASPPVWAQQSTGGTIVIVTGGEASTPIPTLMEGPASTTANFELADQLFLRLAIPRPGGSTYGDDDFVPQLARSWSRPDSLTIVFELDPRARWHDGTPVTARDIVFTFSRALDPGIAPALANLLRYVESVAADSLGRVVIRFRRAYPEQFFDVTWYVAPIPAHLLASLPPDAIARSAFVREPVGSGPYRWARREPGQFIELAADPRFFLGRPGTDRLIFRLATDADARMNLVLSGEADATLNVIPPLSNRDRILETGEMRLLTTPSNGIAYLLFNQRAPGDSTRPHPILADVRVRRAIVAALDRQSMVRAAYGPYAKVPYGPASGMLWISELTPNAPRQNVSAARRLLADAGWRDSDRDGVLDRAGVPLQLTVVLPGTSAPRRQIAVQAQEQLRQIGIRLDVQSMDGPVWGGRHTSGNFDISFASATQNPTPSGLTQSWSCRGGSNVARYCNPIVDSLMYRAILSDSNPSKLWLEVLRRVEYDAAAAFIYAPLQVIAVHKRFEQVAVRADSPWLSVHRWKVRRGQALPRDAVAR